MKKIDEPKAGQPVAMLYLTVVQLVRFANALLNLVVIQTAGAGSLLVSDANATLMVPPGGTAAAKLPFQIVPANNATHPGRVMIVPSNLASAAPDGFGTDPFYLTCVDGDQIYGKVAYSTTGNTIGAVTSRTIANAGTVPDDDISAAIFYYSIGNVAIDAKGNIKATNLAYGPIDCVATRRWFSNPITYLIAWNAAT